MKVIVVGGGIGGLSLALSLHQVGIEARVYEAVRDLVPLGVGISRRPSANSQSLVWVTNSPAPASPRRR
jgi:2-polyprenyl-6-methoxyphenol hydroxylase-like FAD-dependent oxidoreductase